jgi:hypothetical protein
MCALAVSLAALIGAQASSASASHISSTLPSINSFATKSQVISAVKASLRIKSLPTGFAPTISELAGNKDWGGDLQYESTCPLLTTDESDFDPQDCYFGDLNSKFVVALVGDSRARMLLDTMNELGLIEKFKLLILAKSGCPAPLASYETNNDGIVEATPWPACTAFHTFVLSTLQTLQPQVIVVSSIYQLEVMTPTPHRATYSQIKSDTSKFLNALPTKSKAIVLGGFPQPAPTANPTLCLSQKPKSVANCSFALSSIVSSQIDASKAGALEAHVLFVSMEPYFCYTRCSAIVGDDIPYTYDAYHGDKTYFTYLTGVIWDLLRPTMIKADWSPGV